MSPKQLRAESQTRIAQEGAVGNPVVGPLIDPFDRPFDRQCANYCRRSLLIGFSSSR